MPKQHNYTLTDNELEQILDAMTNAKTRIAKRAQMIHGLHLGYTPEEVAQLHNVSLRTVYYHFNRFKAEGRNGLPDRAKSGRPPKATVSYRHRLVEVIEMDPAVLGLGFSIWTLPRLQTFLYEETGIKLSPNRISEVLKEEGYAYRRPKKDLGHYQDDTLRQQVGDAIEEAKKTPFREPSGCSIWMKADLV